MARGETRSNIALSVLCCQEVTQTTMNEWTDVDDDATLMQTPPKESVCEEDMRKHTPDQTSIPGNT